MQERVGTEFLVNSVTNNSQKIPSVTALPGGGFVVTWEDYSGLVGDGGTGNIKAQVFNAAHQKVGAEFLVNTQLSNHQGYPATAALSNGGFVVTWQDSSGTLGDGSSTSIKAQIFNAAGTKVGGEFLVNTQTANGQYWPAITGLTGGGFLITWQDESNTLGDTNGTGIKGQIFGASGQKVGGEFLVNTQVFNHQERPAAAALLNGGFVVTWQDWSGTLGDNSGTSIKAQVFTAAGQKAGGEFLVNTQTRYGQSDPTITGLAGGGFVITWQDHSGTLGDTSGSSVKAQIYSSTGEKVGGEFRVNTYTASGQDQPHVAPLPNGGFVVAWQDFSGTLGDNSGGSIKAQLFDAFGEKLGGEFLVNTQTSGTQLAPSVALLSNGDFVVSWEDSSRTLGDDSGTSVKAQVFTIPSIGRLITGTSGNDSLVGGAGNDTLIGGLGDDTLDGGAGSDTASYEGTSLRVALNLLIGVTIVGSSEIDTLVGIENAIGGSGSDFLLGNDAANTLAGGAGNDNVWGFGGNDSLLGDAGDDVVVGGLGNDTLRGGAGTDWLYGQEGNDAIFGDASPSGGFNVLIGGTGADTLEGGMGGFDYFYDGEGATDGFNDLIVVRANSGIKVMNSFEVGGTNDSVRLIGTGLTSFAQVQANLSFSGIINGTVLVVDANTQIWFLNGTQPAQLTAADFQFA